MAVALQIYSTFGEMLVCLSGLVPYYRQEKVSVWFDGGHRVKPPFGEMLGKAIDHTARSFGLQLCTTALEGLTATGRRSVQVPCVQVCSGTQVLPGTVRHITCTGAYIMLQQ